MKPKILIAILAAALAAFPVFGATPAPIVVTISGDGTKQLLTDINLGSMRTETVQNGGIILVQTGGVIRIQSGGTLDIQAGAVVNFPTGFIPWASVNKAGSSLADLTTRSASDLSSGVLAPTFGGTGLTTYALGDTLYGSAPNVLAKLAGNITTNGNVLTQTGNGSVSAAPAWSATNGTGNVLRSAGTAAITSGKTLTQSNSLTYTGTDGSTVAFGAGGTVLYSGGAYVSSITGTANQITASAATGAVILSLPISIANVNTFTSQAGQNHVLATGTFGTAVTIGSATGNVAIASTTASTAPANGSITTAGGLGVAGSGFFGGTSLSITAPAASGAVLGVNTTGVAVPILRVNGDAGNDRLLSYYTAGVIRWQVAASAGAEAGADAGTAFSVRAFTDGGTQIDAPIAITRAAGGAFTTPRPFNTTSTIASTNTTSGALRSAGGLGVALDIFGGGIISTNQTGLTYAASGSNRSSFSSSGDLNASGDSAPTFLISTATVTGTPGTSGTVTNVRSTLNFNGTAGAITVGRGFSSVVSLGNAMTVAQGHGYTSALTVAGTGNITNWSFFQGSAPFITSTGDVTGTIRGLDLSTNLGRATAANFYGVDVGNVTASLGVNAAFRSSMTAAANKWSLYLDGLASNYVAGELQIGSLTDQGTFALQVTGNQYLSGNQLGGGYLRVGATTAPANTTAGDTTTVRLAVGDVAFGTTTTGGTFSVIGTLTNTASTRATMTHSFGTLSPGSSSSSDFRVNNFGSQLDTAQLFTGTISGTYLYNTVVNASSIADIRGVTGIGFSLRATSLTLGTVTSTSGGVFQAIDSTSNTLGATVTSAYGLRIINPINTGGTPLVITGNAGIAIPTLGAGTNNTHLLIGTLSIPVGNFAIYSSTSSSSFLTGPLSAQAGSLRMATNVSANQSFIIDTAAGINRDMVTSMSAGVQRWVLRTNSTAEGGSNAGSNFAILTYDDAGTSIDSPVTIVRAAGGLLVMNRPVSITSSTDSTSTTTGGLVLSGGLGLAKNLTTAGVIAITPASSIARLDILDNSASAPTWSIRSSTGLFSITETGVSNWMTLTKTTGVIALASTTDSSSSSTGGLTLLGGLGLAKSLNVGTQSGLGIASSSSTALNLAVGTTALSSLRIGHGAAPTSPVNGDVWTTSAGGVFARINSVTQSWLGNYSAASGKTLTVSNSITLAGTDATVMTFPATTATIARTDASQTFTGAQAFATSILMGVGAPLSMASGTNRRTGDATLVAGTVTVANTTVTANTKIQLTRHTLGGTAGDLTYTTSAATSFTVNSANAADTSVVTYTLIENP